MSSQAASSSCYSPSGIPTGSRHVTDRAAMTPSSPRLWPCDHREPGDATRREGGKELRANLLRCERTAHKAYTCDHAPVRPGSVPGSVLLSGRRSPPCPASLCAHASPPLFIASHRIASHRTAPHSLPRASRRWLWAEHIPSNVASHCELPLFS